MIDKEKPAVATATAPAPPVGSATPAPVPPKRSPGHSGARRSKARRTEACRSGEKARREKAYHETRSQEAHRKSRDEIQAESIGQDRQEKVVRGDTARRRSLACPRPDKNRFEKSNPRS